jgi:hypothetical protein
VDGSLPGIKDESSSQQVFRGKDGISALFQRASKIFEWDIVMGKIVCRVVNHIE